jgi:hypothetical protein
MARGDAQTFSSLTQLAELREVTHAPLSRSLFHATAPRIDLPGATEAELRDWQQRLDHELHACGCTAGSFAVLGSVAALAVAEFGLGVDFASGVYEAGVWVGVVLGSASVGKAVGLLRAKLRRHRLYTEIENTLVLRQKDRAPARVERGYARA